MSDYHPMGDEPLRSCVECGFMFSMEDCDEDEELCEECRRYCSYCGDRIMEDVFEHEGSKVFCCESCYGIYLMEQAEHQADLLEGR